MALLCKELTAAPAKALVEGCIALAHLANDVPERPLKKAGKPDVALSSWVMSMTIGYVASQHGAVAIFSNMNAYNA